MPPRWRNSVRPNTGKPGAKAPDRLRASPASGSDAAAATAQRLVAALGCGVPDRSSSVVTPDRAAASASRRVAVRSSRAALPAAAMMTAATP